MTTVVRPIHFVRRGRRTKAVSAPDAAPTALPNRVPRVARLMALAIQFDGMLRKGVVADQSELAEICNVTQPRMTQIMNLLRLAPDIQEAILFLTPARGRERRQPTRESLVAAWRALDGLVRSRRPRPGWRRRDRSRRRHHSKAGDHHPRVCPITRRSVCRVQPVGVRSGASGRSDRPVSDTLGTLLGRGWAVRRRSHTAKRCLRILVQFGGGRGPEECCGRVGREVELVGVRAVQELAVGVARSEGIL